MPLKPLKLGRNDPSNQLGLERAYTEKAKVHPTTADLHWAAGFIEGEGYFDTTVQVSQVNKEPIEKLLSLFGGSIQFELRNAPHNNIWRWSASGARGRGVMLTLYPLMSYKRQEQIARVFKCS